MDEKRDVTEGVEYERPRIADYGTLRDLTAGVPVCTTAVPIGISCPIGY